MSGFEDLDEQLCGARNNDMITEVQKYKLPKRDIYEQTKKHYCWSNAFFIYV